MRRLSLLGVLLLPLVGAAQTVQIKNIQLAGETVIVNYDLDDSSPTNEYQLNLYASTDNFTVPMSKVTGDVGSEIKPGLGKKISWNVKEELGDFNGDISLELRGRVFVVFVKLQNFNHEKTYKSGKRMGLNWKPGNSNPIHIELYKGSERLTGELNHPNSGSYTLSIPPKLSAGKDYRIKITDSKKIDDVLYTEMFTVKPQIPGFVKIIGGAVVLGGGVILGSLLIKEKDNDKGIEDPPGTPEGQ